jgi:hypothetical protein
VSHQLNRVNWSTKPVEIKLTSSVGDVSTLAKTVAINLTKSFVRTSIERSCGSVLVSDETVLPKSAHSYTYIATRRMRRTMRSTIKGEEATFSLSNTGDFLSESRKSETGPSCSMMAYKYGAIFKLGRCVINAKFLARCCDRYLQCLVEESSC